MRPEVADPGQAWLPSSPAIDTGLWSRQALGPVGCSVQACHFGGLTQGL